MENTKKIVVDMSNKLSIEKAERQKMILENKGYNIIGTKQVGLSKFVLTYVKMVKIKGWKLLNKNKCGATYNSEIANLTISNPRGNIWFLHIHRRHSRLLFKSTNRKEVEQRAIKYMKAHPRG